MMLCYSTLIALLILITLVYEELPKWIRMRRALMWVQRSAKPMPGQGQEESFHPARLLLGLCYYCGGKGLIVDKNAARRCFEEALRLSTVITTSMRLTNMNGEKAEGETKNKEGSSELVPSIIVSYYAPAQYALGYLYNGNNRGVEKKSRMKAVIYFSKAAKQGLGCAQFALAKCYEYGIVDMARQEQVEEKNGTAHAQHASSSSSFLLDDLSSAITWYSACLEQKYETVAVLACLKRVKKKYNKEREKTSTMATANTSKNRSRKYIFDSSPYLSDPSVMCGDLEALF